MDIKKTTNQIILPPGLEGGAKTLLVDFPWGKLQQGPYGAENYYDVLPMDRIMDFPLEKLCAEDASLYLWVTNGTIEEGYEVCRKHGFVPRSFITWVKLGKLGLGQYWRSCTEHMIFATRGRAKVQCHNQPNFLFAPVRDHSHKPEEQFAMIERMSPGAYLELFARRPRLGWAKWGLECESDVVIPGYPVPNYSPAITENLHVEYMGANPEISKKYVRKPGRER